MRAGLLVGGLIFLVVGYSLTLTIIGALIGIPVGFIGFLMILVGLFSSGKPAQITVQQTVSADTKKGGEDDSLKILKNRYAKGEITAKEYKDMKKELG